MNARERFHATFEYGQPDRVFLMSQWAFNDTRQRWLRDGCTRKEIEHEVLSKVPQLVKDGGFSPMVDHAVPPDVPFDNFKYYIDLVHEVCTYG
ncbi:MAG: hypothetical protein HY710_13125 [Candidatus Latescibacteria bacterium]|nr:hypothetical protein [Candidatus Latescibacterota bacterium]